MTGIGVQGTVDGHALALGSAALMGEVGVDVAEIGEVAERLRREGASAMFLAVDGHVSGAIAVADPIKDSTPAALAALKAAGLRLVMATGDGRTTAEAVGRQLGIDEVHGELRPEDKTVLVMRLKAEGRRVAMAGDGINDAPALAAADVGIAMGTGTDVAMSSAQVTLVKGDLRGIVRAREISRGHRAEHEAEPGLRVPLQRAGRTGRGRALVPGFRLAHEPDAGRARDEPVLSIGGRQCVAVKDGPFRLRCVQEVRNRS